RLFVGAERAGAARGIRASNRANRDRRPNNARRTRGIRRKTCTLCEFCVECTWLMKIALRDDDTCYFTSPQELERVYADVWDRVPVCLAVVPFAVGYQRAGIPEHEWHSGRRFPLEENPQLVDWLRQRIAEHRITVALHGYTHEDFPSGFEFQAAPDLVCR